MKIVKSVFLIAIIFSMISCGNEEKPVNQEPKPLSRQMFLDQIKKQESEMHKSMTLDPNVASVAVMAYDNFVTHFPNDSLTPDFLFKAAEISTANQQYNQALTYYKTITTKYPNYKLVPESLYLQGYLLDNFLNEDAKAKVIYEEVIAKYPALSYASDAKAAINNLGKTDEELIKEFQKKNKRKF